MAAWRLLTEHVHVGHLVARLLQGQALALARLNQVLGVALKGGAGLQRAKRGSREWPGGLVSIKEGFRLVTGLSCHAGAQKVGPDCGVQGSTKCIRGRPVREESG